MAKKHEVLCRFCKVRFDTNEEEWIMPSKNHYFHRSCYDNWVNKKDDVHTVADDDMWMDASYQFLTRDMLIAVDYRKFQSQFNNFKKKGRTAKGIYFSLLYFYRIKKGDRSKAEGGIGIVDYVYEDATNYYGERTKRGENIVAEIERQVREASQQKEQKVVKKAKKKKTKVVSLDEI